MIKSPLILKLSDDTDYAENTDTGGDKMGRRSKLELYLDLLKVLEHGEPMKPTRIMYEVNVAYIFLEQFLSFLTEHELVRKVLDGNRVEYAIAQRGLDLLRTYGELKKSIPPVEEKKNREILVNNVGEK